MAGDEKKTKQTPGWWKQQIVRDDTGRKQWKCEKCGYTVIEGVMDEERCPHPPMYS